MKSVVGKRLAALLLTFCRCYQAVVVETHNRGWNRYSLVPKIHFLHHIGIRMQAESDMADYCCNPLSESVQMQEDYI